MAFLFTGYIASAWEGFGVIQHWSLLIWLIQLMSLNCTFKINKKANFIDIRVLPLFKEINNHAISSLLNCILQLANCMVCKLYHNRILKIMKAYSCPVLSDLAVYVEEDSIQQLSFHLPLPCRHISICFYVQRSMRWDHWRGKASWLGEKRKKGLSCVCPCAFWEWQPMLARVWDGGEVVLVRRLLRLHF